MRVMTVRMCSLDERGILSSSSVIQTSPGCQRQTFLSHLPPSNNLLSYPTVLYCRTLPYSTILYPTLPFSTITYDVLLASVAALTHVRQKANQTVTVILRLRSPLKYRGPRYDVYVCMHASSEFVYEYVCVYDTSTYAYTCI